MTELEIEIGEAKLNFKDLYDELGEAKLTTLRDKANNAARKVIEIQSHIRNNKEVHARKKLVQLVEIYESLLATAKATPELKAKPLEKEHIELFLKYLKGYAESSNRQLKSMRRKSEDTAKAKLLKRKAKSSKNIETTIKSGAGKSVLKPLIIAAFILAVAVIIYLVATNKL